MLLHLDPGAVATLNWMARWPRRALEEKCPEGSSTLTSGQTQAGWQDIWGARSVSKVILFVVCTSPPLLRQTLNFRWSCIFIKTIRFSNLFYITLLNRLAYQRIHALKFHFLLFDHGGTRISLDGCAHRNWRAWETWKLFTNTKLF